MGVAPRKRSIRKFTRFHYLSPTHLKLAGSATINFWVLENLAVWISVPSLFLPKAESETRMSALVAWKFSWYFNGPQAHKKTTSKNHDRPGSGFNRSPFFGFHSHRLDPTELPSSWGKKMQKSQLQLQSWQVSIWILVILTKNHGNMVEYVPNNPYYSWLHPQQSWGWSAHVAMSMLHCYSQTMRICGTGATFGYFMHIYFSQKNTHFCCCRSPCLADVDPTNFDQMCQNSYPFGYD